MTSPVEELREAATRLRELAEATARPHHPYGDERLPLVKTTEAWSAEVRNYLGGAMGDYCASLHPVVALTLATAMEKVARVVQFDEHMIGRVGYGELLQAARVYLGRRGEQR